jgi:hypothetical protein
MLVMLEVVVQLVLVQEQLNMVVDMVAILVHLIQLKLE